MAQDRREQTPGSTLHPTISTALVFFSISFRPPASQARPPFSFRSLVGLLFQQIACLALGFCFLLFVSYCLLLFARYVFIVTTLFLLCCSSLFLLFVYFFVLGSTFVLCFC